MDDLVSEFIAETRANIAILMPQLQVLNAATDTAQLQNKLMQLMREIRATCGFLQLPEFENLAQAGEDLLAAKVQDWPQKSTDLLQQISALIDNLSPMDSVADMVADAAKPVPHLLYVEASLFFRQLTLPYLQHEWPQISCAQNSAEALAILHSQPVTHLLLALDYDSASVLQLVRQIRSDPQFVALPISVFSNDFAGKQAELIAAGVNDVITITTRAELAVKLNA
jgi:CheY-like chemotaxis protein